MKRRFAVVVLRAQVCGRLGQRTHHAVSSPTPVIRAERRSVKRLVAVVALRAHVRARLDQGTRHALG